MNDLSGFTTDVREMSFKLSLQSFPPPVLISLSDVVELNMHHVREYRRQFFAV